MKRRHRVNINQTGHAHELTFSCYKLFPFLQSDLTCEWLADSIESARQELGFSLWAYVFMPNHVHMIVFPRAGTDIAKIRQAIKAPVARKAILHVKANAPEWLPRITRTRGGKRERLFWQSGGGYDRNIIDARTLQAMIDYIHANPVRKQLVERASDWKWSSAAWYFEQRAVPLAVDPIPWEWLE